MLNENDGPFSHATIRHEINNMLNALSMQLELATQFMKQGNLEAADKVMSQAIKDCKRYSSDVRALLPD